MLHGNYSSLYQYLPPNIGRRDLCGHVTPADGYLQIGQQQQLTATA